MATRVGCKILHSILGGIKRSYVLHNTYFFNIFYYTNKMSQKGKYNKSRPNLPPVRWESDNDTVEGDADTSDSDAPTTKNMSRSFDTEGDTRGILRSSDAPHTEVQPPQSRKRVAITNIRVVGGEEANQQKDFVRMRKKDEREEKRIKREPRKKSGDTKDDIPVMKKKSVEETRRGMEEWFLFGKDDEDSDAFFDEME